LNIYANFIFIRFYVIIYVADMWRSILVSWLYFEGGAKNPPRAHRWSSWCWLSTPSWGLVLGVKEDGVNHNGMWKLPRLCGDPSAWGAALVGQGTTAWN